MNEFTAIHVFWASNVLVENVSESAEKLLDMTVVWKQSSLNFVKWFQAIIRPNWQCDGKEHVSYSE